MLGESSHYTGAWQTRPATAPRTMLQFRILAKSEADRLSAHRAVYWDWDPATNAMTWSGGTAGMFRGMAPPPTRAAWSALVHPHDRADVDAALAQLVRRERMRVDCRYRLALEPGWQRVTDRAFAIRQPTGPPRLIGAVTVDGDAPDAPVLSAQERLEESETRFKTFVANLPLLAWEADADGWVRFYNQRWFDYTGTTFEAMEGWGWVDVHDPNDLPRMLKVFRTALSTGEPWEDEFRLRRADGSMRWHLSRAFPLRDTRGAIVRWFGTNTDVHDQRLALQERERLYEVEHLLRREAENANQQKDEFLAVVSHELRSPLNAILGWTQMIRDGLLTGDAILPAVSKIESSGRMLSGLIEDLLDVSRIVSGKLEIDRVPVDLTAAVTSAVETMRTEAARKNVGIRAALPGGEGLWMLGSQQRLEQIVTNLLTNAIKFSRRGQRVEVGAHREAGEIVVTVRDHGEGIAPELLNAIFSPFRQGDSSRRRRHGGLGLGLSIVRHLTQLHGGSITAASDGPGTGACFTVRLPAGIAAAPPAAAPLPLPMAPISLAGLTVLAVDDEEEARDVIASTLLSRGATVRVVRSVAEALEALRSESPDVIVSDISMAEVDGYGLVERLRQSGESRWARIPVVALTAAASEQDRARALSSGFTSYVTKPFDGHALSALILDLARARMMSDE